MEASQNSSYETASYTYLDLKPDDLSLLATSLGEILSLSYSSESHAATTVENSTTSISEVYKKRGGKIPV